MLIGIIHIVIFAKNDKNKIGFNSIYAILLPMPYRSPKALP